MKRFIAATLLAAAPVALSAEAASLEIKVDNLTEDTGTVRIALYASEADWRSDEVTAGASIDVAAGESSAMIEGLEAGTYGIKLYHDVDDDGEIARGSFGIPSEPYGFSQDAPVRFGPPSWSAAAFEVSGEATSHTITLR